MGLVSVIIPCYNCADYIEETIQSVIQQSHAKFEIICIDNNSTDKTSLILKELKLKYPFIITDSEEKSGASYARTKGFALSNGDYVQFLDSDDIIHRDKFKVQIAAIQKQNLDWVFSDRSVMNQDLTKTIKSFTYENLMQDPIGYAISSVITSGNPLYTRRAVTQVGGYTPHLKVGQDWDFHLKLILAKTKFGYVKGDYFQSRTVEGSLSSNWFSVSLVLCDLIIQYKESFTALGVLSNIHALSKIHQVYYFTAISTIDEERYQSCVNELKYWKQKADITNSLGSKDSILIKLLGLENAIKARRIISSKLT